MKIRILGSGTSTGVPVIGCKCTVCTSTEVKNRRTRASALFELEDKSILIDTSTDFRIQALVNGIDRVDGVLFTHHHADHIHGIDDLRTFNRPGGDAIPCYGSSVTVSTLRERFDYIFKKTSGGGWKPLLDIFEVSASFKLAGTEVTPLPVSHGTDNILGFRIGDGAYITDCSSIPDGTRELLKGLKVLVLDALRHKPHPTHFTIDQALIAVAEIAPERTVFTHLSHDVDYIKDKPLLPENVEFAYDGMVIEV